MRLPRSLLGMLLALLVLSGLPSLATGECSTALLNTELTTDPASLGYQTHIDVPNDNALATILNTVQTGDEDYRVSKGVVTFEQFRGTWGDVLQQVESIANDASTQGEKDREATWKWTIESLLLPGETVDYAAQTAIDFFTAATNPPLGPLKKGDGTDLTSADVTARTTRFGSRAEVVCGSGTTVTISQISLALRGF